jgi:hypothetical protein
MKNLKKLKHWKLKIETDEDFLNLLKEYGGNKALCDWGLINGILSKIEAKGFFDFLIQRLIEFGIWCERNKLVEHSNKPFKIDKKEIQKLPTMCG